MSGYHAESEVPKEESTVACIEPLNLESINAWDFEDRNGNGKVVSKGRVYAETEGMCRIFLELEI